MNLNRVIDRLVRAVGVRETRREDDERREKHGGTPAEWHDRQDKHAQSLKQRFTSLLGSVD